MIWLSYLLACSSLSCLQTTGDTSGASKRTTAPVIHLIRQEIFVRARTSKSVYYVHEPILVVYKLYSRLSSDTKVLTEPDFRHFTVLPDKQIDTSSSSTEVIGGNRYEVRMLYQKWLVPIVPGMTTISSLIVRHIVHTAPSATSSNQSLQDVFNQVSKDQTSSTTLSYTESSPPVSIQILPLPEEGKPLHFSGAVGQFSLQAGLEKRPIAAGQTAQLNVTILGMGNLPPGAQADIPWPKDISGYDVRTLDKSIPDPPAASRLLAYSFSSVREGNIQIPPATFAYFDPQSKSYKEARSTPIEVNVQPALAGPSAGSDISGTATPVGFSALWGRLSGWVTGHPATLLGVLFLLALAGWGTTWYVLWRRQKKGPFVVQVSPVAMTEPIPPEVPEAIPSPPPPLEGAEQLLSSGDYIAFYSELRQGLWKGLDAGPGGIDFPGQVAARERLGVLGWDASQIARANDIFNACDISLYTPVHQHEAAEQWLKKAKSLLRERGDEHLVPEVK
jgi:hypothetical protein